MLDLSAVVDVSILHLPDPGQVVDILNLLHEHGDSALVHLEYAYYLAKMAGAQRAIEFLTQPQYRLSDDLLLRVASDAARELKEKGIAANELHRLRFEVDYRLNVLGYDKFALAPAP